MDSDPPERMGAPSNDPMNTQPPVLGQRKICGFWRRVAALMIDSLPLGVVGLVMGWFFFDALAQLGSGGRLLGFAIALLYFGILNSSVGRGQTLGKRAMGIEVVDGAGRHIRARPLRASLLRAGRPLFSQRRRGVLRLHLGRDSARVCYFRPRWCDCLSLYFQPAHATKRARSHRGHICGRGARGWRSSSNPSLAGTFRCHRCGLRRADRGQRDGRTLGDEDLRLS